MWSCSHADAGIHCPGEADPQELCEAVGCKECSGVNGVALTPLIGYCVVLAQLGAYGVVLEQLLGLASTVIGK